MHYGTFQLSAKGGFFFADFSRVITREKLITWV